MTQWDGTFIELHKLISTITDDIKSLLRVLDDISKIHPFITSLYLFHTHCVLAHILHLTAVVGTFRVAFALEQKRRYNDKKILLMFVEMGDMMAVLVQ